MWEIGKAKPDIDTLVTIAGFFGVTTDYLLGKSDVKSVDTEMQAVCKFTGLTEKAVEVLQYWVTIGFFEARRQTLNLLIEQETPQPDPNDFLRFDEATQEWEPDDDALEHARRKWERSDYVTLLASLSDYLFTTKRDPREPDDAEVDITNEGELCDADKITTGFGFTVGRWVIKSLPKKKLVDNTLLVDVTDKAKLLKIKVDSDSSELRLEYNMEGGDSDAEKDEHNN
jgi:transcriptional regulator with XRE-family HTH domain